MALETEQQMLWYDFSGIVAGIGGSLGLFLGFSCLNATDTFIDAVFSKCGKNNNRKISAGS